MELLKNFTDYLNSRYNHLSKKTVKNYRADVGVFIKWYEGIFNTPFIIDSSRVTLETLDLYKKTKILQSNLSPRSFKRHLSSLRRFFEFLKREGIISQDPFEVKAENALALENKWHMRAFRNYLYLDNKSNHTIKNYILDIQGFLTWAQHSRGENILAQIDQILVNQYKERLLGEGFSPRTINRNLSSLRKYLNWIAKQGMIQDSELKNKTIESCIEMDKKEPETGLQSPTTYSSFPPLRLMQKIFRAADFIFEITLIFPLLKTTQSLNYIISSIKGKPIFTSSSKFKVSREAKSDLENAGSGFARQISKLDLPAELPFPWHKKVFQHIRHKRPKWYQIYHSYSITDYFHLSFLIISMSILGFAIYQNITGEKQKEKSILSSFTSYSPRIISFKGQLTDSSNNPIGNVDTALRVAIYNDDRASGGTPLWEEIINVRPDSQGKFLTFLGDTTPLPPSLFSQEPLWLGIAIGNSPELTPRQPLSTVTLAKNAENLQGLPPITNPDADTKNVVLALDSSGNLTIGGNANPTFQATGGSFKLLGETLVLSTTPGTNSNVEIAPTDLGKIDVQKPIFNSTSNNNMDMAIGAVEINDSLAVLATSSATSAFTINQNSTGKLISAYTGNAAKFTVDNNGNIISETGTKWQPFSDSTSALNIANAAGNTFLTFDTVNSRLRFLQDSTERSELFYQNSDSAFHIRSASGSGLALDTDNSNAPKVYIATSGNLGIGTITPVFRLDVQDSKSASAAAQIFNTNAETDADGLIVKLGNTSTTSVNSSNRFISFETSGIGIVGSVRGDGSTGVEFKTEGIADFAEYLKKDKNQDIPYGSVICIDHKGAVIPCDKTYNKIIGVSSNQGGFTGGEDNKEESIRVGLIGQVYTKVSNMNGDIKPGDALTSSRIPGIAVKAISTGQIVGKAMEPLSCHPEQSEARYHTVLGEGSHGERDSSAPPQNDNTCQGKILVAISVSWYDPDAHQALAADLPSDTKATEEKNLKDRISAAKFDLVAIIQDYMQGSKIISPIAKFDQADSDIISPLPTKSLVTTLNHSSEAQATNSAIQSSQNEKTASFEAVLSGSELVRDTSLSSKFTLPRNTYSVNSQPSVPLSNYYVKSLSVETPTFTQGLISFGPTSLSDTSITGQLSIGAIILQDNSINTFGANLALQPLRQGGLSIMGDLVYIDTDGNLKVTGNAEFAKDVKVGGDIVASGSGTFTKLNLTLAKEALALSQRELIATGAAGTAYVRSHELEVSIKNSLVTDKSLIYITPVGTPSSQMPYLMRQVPNISFTVGIASKSATNTPFNWLIIN